MAGKLRMAVIGIGNPDRGDDGAGRAVARRLDGHLPEGVALIGHDGEATSLLAHLSDLDAVWLVDAAVSGVPAGTVRRFDLADKPLPAGTYGVSTHGMGLVEAVELARTLGQLPQTTIVFAIEGAAFDHGAELSPQVAAALADAAREVADDVDRFLKTGVESHA